MAATPAPSWGSGSPVALETQMPNLTERYLVPGERRVVDVASAVKLRALATRAAADVGMDKVTAAVVLADLAVELLALNRPPYGPEVVREVHERAIVVHYAARAAGAAVIVGPGGLS